MRFQVLLATCAGIVLTFLQTAVAQDAFPIPGDRFGSSTPAVGELDNNVANGLETALVSLDGKVQVVKNDGSIQWSVDLPNVSCAETPRYDKSHSSAVIGELFGNGVQYVVVGFGGFQGKPCDGGVAAYRALDGSRAWVFSIKRWSQRRRFFAFRHAVIGTPTLADVNGDGKLEVGFGALDRNIYLLNSNGSVRWFAHAADTVFSSPSFVDINKDGKLEMIISTDISQNKRLRPPTPDGGYVYALRAALRVPRGTLFGFRDPRLQIWRTEFNQVMQASPAIGDVLPQNPGPEVVVGSGCFFPQGAGDRRGKWYKVLSAKTGRVLKTLPVSACTPTAPALADLDGDTVLDVVAGISGASSAGGDGSSHLLAWSPSRDSTLWDVILRSGSRNDALAGHYKRTPTVADITGDGIPEVLINYASDVAIFTNSGAMLTCSELPCSLPLLRTDSTLKGSPVVTDTDRDGIVEVLVGGSWDDQSSLIKWEHPLGME